MKKRNRLQRWHHVGHVRCVPRGQREAAAAAAEGQEAPQGSTMLTFVMKASTSPVGRRFLEYKSRTLSAHFAASSYLF
jgi:hypothetical protein